MTIVKITQYVGMAIPLISFGALVVSIIIFVKYKGTIDALKDAAETYRTLANSYKEQIGDLSSRLESCEGEVKKLEAHVVNQKLAIQIAIDETIAGFHRAGYCENAADCKLCKGGVE